ncbi:LysR family transcriptional regulator [Alphaproteobacteria bacterium KMM 3653]|uniref:LysR family transcriptional regulator n=1 Tax=Harenicola maris TaxID=2841044 RepID=A0AAP2CKM3_9RHOB|nr:LysR family transcriptional regulator [Harenicola maris]
MRRNLDTTALRAFVTVAETGGVTKAAGSLNLTQSAVSMQIKRLEEALSLDLIERAGRGIALTPSGEQLLAYARRIIALNDEAVGRLTADEFEGVITLGVPHDIVTPFIPRVLKRFAAAYPRMELHLTGSYTVNLLDQYARGEVDIILTTELTPGPGSVTLAQPQLVWVGAVNGEAWRGRPLPLAFEHNCLFRPAVQRHLDEAGIAWSAAVKAENSRTVEATVAADLAVHTILEGTSGWGMEPIQHGGALPDLERYNVNLYRNPARKGQAYDDLVAFLTEAYAEFTQPLSQRPSRLSAVI